MSIFELAEATGICSVDLIRIENCQRAVTTNEIESICSAFKIDSDQLLEITSNDENIIFADMISDKMNMSHEEYEEIREVDLLIDALNVQKEIYNLLSLEK